MLNVRNVSAAVGLTFLLTVYLKQAPGEIGGVGNGGVARQAYGGGDVGEQVRNVVAYSLKKRLELEGEALECSRMPPGGGPSGGSHLQQRRWSRVDATEVYVYSSHLDRRLSPYDYVRILGMSKGSWNRTLFCNLVLEDGILKVARAIRTDIWSDTWTDGADSINYKPVLISCQLPVAQGYIKVYLSNYPCQTGEGSLLVHSGVNRRSFDATPFEVVTCVKPLDFQGDISNRLIEWIEMNRILGASTIQVYVKRVHPNVLKVLNWYSSDGRIKVIKDVHFPGLKNNIWQKRKNEILTYNHCFYEHLHKTRYILPIDIDEFIIPKNSTTWHEILSSFPAGYASYSVRNTYFFTSSGFNGDTPTPIFTNFERTIYSKPGESGKSFVATSEALTVFNHYALHSLRPGVGKCHFLPVEVVQMNHYKETCPVDLLPDCTSYLSSPRIHDDLVIKYKSEFDERYAKTKKHLNLS